MTTPQIIKLFDKYRLKHLLKDLEPVKMTNFDLPIEKTENYKPLNKMK
jgi:hypothetical protein